jgi:hypothetical protein
VVEEHKVLAPDWLACLKLDSADGIILVD